jgi:hypothetical protein
MLLFVGIEGTFPESQPLRAECTLLALQNLPLGGSVRLIHFQSKQSAGVNKYASGVRHFNRHAYSNEFVFIFMNPITVAMEGLAANNNPEEPRYHVLVHGPRSISYGCHMGPAGAEVPAIGYSAFPQPKLEAPK